ncbi:hypothetical protein LJR225_005313 [Phenylobacterium sp. LjRoot225]|uniref:hypothetical protein n=1 Tax=Phenylobacterium sp. LjRoot225 TaxID=3342285 RepID=UPI003ED09E50
MITAMIRLQAANVMVTSAARQTGAFHGAGEDCFRRRFRRVRQGADGFDELERDLLFSSLMASSRRFLSLGVSLARSAASRNGWFGKICQMR